jgi:hypothetical protein
VLGKFVLTLYCKALIHLHIFQFTTAKSKYFDSWENIFQVKKASKHVHFDSFYLAELSKSVKNYSHAELVTGSEQKKKNRLRKNEK